jgi:hypothetical protein
MRLSWSKEAKLDFISEALVNNQAERFLSSEREAKLFRFSLYRILHSNGHHQYLSISQSGRKLTLVKSPNIMKKANQ